MKQSIIILIAIAITSCGSNSYTCVCKTDDAEIANYIIEADKEETAAFECGQKELQFSGKPEFEGMKCTIKASE